MDIQHSAIKELNDFLVRLETPYVLIGGIALQQWGEPRYTQDVDLSIVLDMARELELVHEITSHFAPRISNADVFALDNRVILVRSASGCPIDISLGLPGYEEEVISRSVSVDLSPEIRGIKVCTAEDLVVMKIVAGRPRDIDDVEGIIIRQQDALDYGYIRLKLKTFDELLETSELLERFEEICLSVQSMAKT
jgi:predicted nucleotidyltransferase